MNIKKYNYNRSEELIKNGEKATNLLVSNQKMHIKQSKNALKLKIY